MRNFSAPWSPLLKVLTAVSVLILGGIALVGLLAGPRHLLAWQLGMVGLPLFILLAALPFMILGYRIERGELKVMRLGWTTSIPLGGLQSAEADPEAMSRSIRTFGNGGLFCFAGRYRNRRLGHYRVWATDPGRAVVLKFPERTLVVSPDRPDRFVDALAPLIESG